MTGENFTRRALWRHRDFLKLWCAETVSQLGSQMTLLALPLIAISVMHADVLEVGTLSAIEVLPFVVFGLPAGAWIDRVARRPVLIASDLGRAALLASIPAAWALGVLTLWQLYIVAFCVGTLTVFFDVAYEALLPALVSRDQLLEGNAKLELSRSAAAIAGPSLAGPLITIVSAPFALVIDVVSFIGSAGCIGAIRAREPNESRDSPGDAATSTMLHDIKEGLAYVFRHRYLRAIAACTATSNLFFAMNGAVLLVYLVRESGLDAAQTGLLLGVGNIGFLAGAMSNDRLASWLGVGNAIVAAIVIGGLGGLLIPFAPAAHVASFVAIAQFLTGFSTTTYNINQVSLRQALAPERLRGRVNATMRFVVWGTLPLGSVLGGVSAQLLGLRPTLWIAAFGGLMPVAWLLLSPVRDVVHIPSVETS